MFLLIFFIAFIKKARSSKQADGNLFFQIKDILVYIINSRNQLKESMLNSNGRSSYRGSIGMGEKKEGNSKYSYEQKIQNLCKVRYKNQLAQLDHEEKVTELFTRHSVRTKQTVMKKIKAKNQIAEFIDEEQQYQQEVDELFQFNQPISKKEKFYFERESQQKQYAFCPLCDEIYTVTPEIHTEECGYKSLCKSPGYYFESLKRIQTVLGRMTSTEAEQLQKIAKRIEKSQNVKRQLDQMLQLVSEDPLLLKVGEKLRQIMLLTQN